jgi:hypothetical protein
METTNSVPAPDVRRRFEQAMSHDNDVDVIRDLAQLTGVAQDIDMSDLESAITYNQFAMCPVEWSGTKVTGGESMQENCKTLASLFVLVLGMCLLSGHTSYAYILIDRLTMCHSFKQYLSAGITYVVSKGKIDPVMLGSSLLYLGLFIQHLQGVTLTNAVTNRAKIVKAFEVVTGTKPTTGGARKRGKTTPVATRKAPVKKAAAPRRRA